MAVAMAAAGALLLAGCGSSSTASAPSAAESAPTVSNEAPASFAPTPSAPAEVTTEQVVAKWTCANDGGKVTCTCEGTEADCKSTVTKPSKLKGLKKGTVVFFNTEKGFGFIKDSGTGNEIFVHISGITSEVSLLEPGQEVTFDVTQGKMGLNAVKVTVE